MGNASVITVERNTFKTAQAFDDYVKWAKASRTLMNMSTGYLLGVEASFPFEDKLTYITINHYKDLENYFDFQRSTERNAWEKDTHITWGGKLERSWRALYLVVKRFNLFQVDPINKGAIVDKTTYLKEFTEEDAPVVSIKGLALSSNEWEKYDAWMNQWGYDIYLPLLFKAPGIIEYCRCWLSNVSRESFLGPKPSYTINAEFPQDLSIIYFEKMRAYQNFQKSRELEAYNRNLTNAFPKELNYKWDIVFRLARRFSK